MSNRLFQGIIHQMQESIDRVIGIVNDASQVVACSDLTSLDTSREYLSLDFSQDETFIRDGYTYRPFGGGQRSEFAVFVEGADEIATRYAGILAVAVGGIKKYYDEKYDRANFIKNVILDNILPGDVYIKARELHFRADVSRVVFLIRILAPSGLSAYEVIQNLFPDRQKDFVFTISETEIVIVKEISAGIESRDLEKLARSMVDTLSAEFYTRVVVGIGTAVNGIKELSRSFKEAQISLEVGNVFDSERSIIRFDNLGIARLIYQLPTTLCELYLREVFVKGSIDSLDKETLFTIQKFFENNLNVSETSRKLFVHRNTLVYRLEKIKKITGLDLREFDHAIVFKVALMVKKYLNANPAKF
jgi:carbohydrate diacid regulator